VPLETIFVVEQAQIVIVVFQLVSQVDQVEVLPLEVEPEVEVQAEVLPLEFYALLVVVDNLDSYTPYYYALSYYNYYKSIHCKSSSTFHHSLKPNYYHLSFAVFLVSMRFF
jgi:hypothetical protein